VKSTGSSTGVSSPKSDCKRKRRIKVIEVTKRLLFGREIEGKTLWVGSVLFECGVNWYT